MELATSPPSKLPRELDPDSSESNIAYFLVPCFDSIFCTEIQLNHLIDLIMQTERELDSENLEEMIPENEETVEKITVMG